MTKKQKYKALFEKSRGIKLDVGCSSNCQRGWVGMDIRKCQGVDIVHDVQVFPWPIPDNSCFTILMSHLYEHIMPHNRIKLIDECWRVLKPGGQLLLTAPYATSIGAFQDPTHYPCPNEATFTYFDPAYPLWNVYCPKPWTLVRNNYRINGNMEVIMEPRKTDAGKQERKKVEPKKSRSRK